MINVGILYFGILLILIVFLWWNNTNNIYLISFKNKIHIKNYNIRNKKLQ